MPLAKQIVPLPLVGGISESDDALLSPRPQQMTNCVYRKTGAVSKRYGYDCIGAYNRRSDATMPPVGEHLTTFSGELLRVGGGRIDTYQTIGTSSEWISRGRVPECVVQSDSIVASGATASNVTNPAIAYANGFIIAAYVLGDTVNNYVYADVINASTGARVFSRYLLQSSPNGLSSPKVVSTGTTAAVFWGDASAVLIRGRFLDLVAMAWAPVKYIAAQPSPAGVATFDVDIVDSATVVLVQEVPIVSLPGSTPPNATIQAMLVYSTGVGAFDTSGGTYIPSTATGSVYSVRYTTLRIWISVGFSAGGAAVGTLGPALTGSPYQLPIQYGLVSVAGSYSNTSVIGIESVTSTTASLAWSDFTASKTCWATVSIASGPPAYSSVSSLQRSFLMTRPVVRNGTAYALVVNIHATHATQFMVDLTNAQANGSPRMVAVVLPRQLPSISVGSYSNAPRSKTVASWAQTATNEWTTVSLIGATQAYSYNVVTLRMKFDAAWTRTSCQSGTLLTLGGGVVTGYDGAQSFEQGFAYEPDYALVTSSSYGFGGGSMLINSTYHYAFVYAWTDGQGNVHRSKPSQPVAASTTSAGNITVVIPCLHLTNKDSDLSTPNIVIEIYRTAFVFGVEVATYHYLASVRNQCGSATVSYTDSASDSSITPNATIYTTGGVLDHLIPSSASLVFPWKSGLILGGTDDGSLWISGEILANEGAAFNAQSTVAPFDGGRFTAMSALDTTLVLFKSTGIWLIDGEPPNDLGQASTMTSPRRVQTDVGCTDATSVVQTADGVAFRAPTGLYILNRSLVVSPIGKGVENSYAAGGFAGAANLSTQYLIRWVQKDGTALNLDTYHGGTWSKDVLYDVQAGTSAAPVAATLWNGAFVWLSSNGYLYRENTSLFVDGGTRWVPMSFETSVEKPGGVSLYQRVWRVYIVANVSTACGVTVTLTTDGGSESRTWASALSSMMVHVKNQKSRWMRVLVADAAPAGAMGTGEGIDLRDVSLELGVKPTGARVPSANRQ